MQLSFKDRFLNTRDATSVVVDSNNLREALKNCLGDNFVATRYYNDNDAKRNLAKIKSFAKNSKIMQKQRN